MMAWWTLLVASHLQFAQQWDNAINILSCHRSCQTSSPVSINSLSCHRSCQTSSPVSINSLSCHRSCQTSSPVSINSLSCHRSCQTSSPESFLFCLVLCPSPSFLLPVYSPVCYPVTLSKLQCAVDVCWLLNVPATCECISRTDLLRQVYVLPNFPSHPVTVY